MKSSTFHEWPSLCTLWNTRSKWEICVESAVFVGFQCCFSWKAQRFSWKAQRFSWKVPLFMKSTMLFTVSFSVITKYRSFFRKTKHRVTIPCKWSFEKRRFSRKAVLFTKSGAFHMKSGAFHKWPSLCTLWNTRSKWEICVESAVFVGFQCCFSWKVQRFSLWAFRLSPSIGLSFERPKIKQLVLISVHSQKSTELNISGCRKWITGLGTFLLT